MVLKPRRWARLAILPEAATWVAGIMVAQGLAYAVSIWWAGIGILLLLLAAWRSVAVVTRLRRALSDTRNALHRAQTMEAVGRLTVGVAHDFNNHLTVIGSNIEMVAGRLGPDQAKLSRHTDAAMQGVRRAAQLTGRLLAFSRRPAPDPEAVDVDRLVGGLAELLRRTIGGGIGLEVRLSGSPWFVWADVNQMENALLSLVVNAREQVPDGGVLSLAVSNVQVTEASAPTPATAPGEYIQIEISGIGGARDWAADLFMARAFVRQAGGTLIHDPGPRLLLPRHLPPRGAARARPPGAGARVLVVEDDDGLRGLCGETLRAAGYDVLEAPDAMEAFRLITDHGGIDLLFTDLGLPGGVGGRALADAARNLDDTIRVLFTTGQDRSDLPERASVLRKPFRPDDLVAATHNALADNAPPDNGVAAGPPACRQRLLVPPIPSVARRAEGDVAM